MRLIRLLLMRYRLRHERWRLAGDTGKNAGPPSQTGGFFVVSGTIVRLSYCVFRSTVPAWQSENERFTTARTVTDGFSAAKATICLFCIEPTSRPAANSHRWSLEIFFAKAMLDRSIRRFAE